MKQGTVVKIANTESNLDGVVGTIVGISFDCRPNIGSIYVVKPNTDEFLNGYETICMSDACLSVELQK